MQFLIVISEAAGETNTESRIARDDSMSECAVSFQTSAIKTTAKLARERSCVRVNIEHLFVGVFDRFSQHVNILEFFCVFCFLF